MLTSLALFFDLLLLLLSQKNKNQAPLTTTSAACSRSSRTSTPTTQTGACQDTSQTPRGSSPQLRAGPTLSRGCPRKSPTACLSTTAPRISGNTSAPGPKPQLAAVSALFSSPVASERGWATRASSSRSPATRAAALASWKSMLIRSSLSKEIWANYSRSQS